MPSSSSSSDDESEGEDKEQGDVGGTSSPSGSGSDASLVSEDDLSQDSADEPLTDEEVRGGCSEMGR